tara:strand:+ start:1336 stop:1620 length:285 start_codon:yes stop_codon:yes gene_type:complete
MFSTIKKLLGVSPPEVNISDSDAGKKIKSAKSVTKPVTVTPKKAAKPKGENKASLSKMTKLQIDELAKEKFGADLDRRSTKDSMIKAFLKLQKG